MAQLVVTVKARPPVWCEDYLALVVKLGMDCAEATRFVVMHYEISWDDGKTWLPLWVEQEPC